MKKYIAVALFLVACGSDGGDTETDKVIVDDDKCEFTAGEYQAVYTPRVDGCEFGPSTEMVDLNEDREVSVMNFCGEGAVDYDIMSESLAECTTVTTARCVYEDSTMNGVVTLKVVDKTHMTGTLAITITGVDACQSILDIEAELAF